MKLSGRRSGFSLAEALVATVILGIVGGALTRLVVDQMRFFDGAYAVRSARSTARNSTNVLLADLRMVPTDAGITAASATSITVRVPYRFGLVCGTAGGKTTVSMLPVDSLTGAMAVFSGYAYRPRQALVSAATPYTYPVGAALTRPSSQSTVCTTTAGIKTVTVNAGGTNRAGEIDDVTPAITMDATTNVVGMAVMFYQTITYSFAASTFYPGKTALWRSVSGGVNEELMAPFASTSKFKFYTAGADAAVTTVPSPLTNITGLDIQLDAVGNRTPAGRTAPPQQKLTTSVFFRNIP